MFNGLAADGHHSLKQVLIMLFVIVVCLFYGLVCVELEPHAYVMLVVPK